MIIKSKYKIARKFGQIYEKTQTQKFVARSGRRTQKKSFGPKSGFAKSLLEKQKARFTYGINERQFEKYALSALAEKNRKPEDVLYEILERRLDNVVYRIGLLSTRLFARQGVNHGHISINGKRVHIPSFKVNIGDKICIMPSKSNKKIFENIGEKIKEKGMPNWIKFDPNKTEGTIVSLPKFDKQESSFDMSSVLDFYRR